MTGFGQASITLDEGIIQAEVKSLNSKFLDVSLRLSSELSDKELEVRTLVQEHLERGKIAVTVAFERRLVNAAAMRYKEEEFITHYLELKKLADRVMAPYDNLFEIALRSPEVSTNGRESLPTPALEAALKCLSEALRQCTGFREKEGEVLAGKLGGYADKIQELLGRVEKLDPVRIEKIRTRIRKNVIEFFGHEGFDPNRLEQEILFYAEKLDTHEERVRLRAHLDYFRDVLKEDTSNGKKLGFITQEIGREINTLGSKANDAEIQRDVVRMKEELEKIKEQLNNVL